MDLIACRTHSPKKPRTPREALFSGVARDYLLSGQVMARLGIGRQTMLRLIAEGNLRGVKEGRLWLVEEDSVREYAKKRSRVKRENE